MSDGVPQVYHMTQVRTDSLSIQEDLVEGTPAAGNDGHEMPRVRVVQ
jgi:hypothetical protein